MIKIQIGNLHLLFCMMTNRMGRMLQSDFDEDKITPRVYTGSTYSRIGMALCEQGKAVCIVSQMAPVGNARRDVEEREYLPSQGKGRTVITPDITCMDF